MQYPKALSTNRPSAFMQRRTALVKQDEAMFAFERVVAALFWG